jgi:antitoxin YefM
LLNLDLCACFSPFQEEDGQQSVVMLSPEDFQALEESAYLLRNPANAKRLLAAVGQLNAGKGVARELTA